MSGSIPNLVISTVTMLGSLTAGVMSIKNAKVHGDPVRSGLRLVPISIGSLFISTVLDVATYAAAVEIYLERKFDHGYFTTTLSEPTYYVSYVSLFFSTLAWVVLFLALLNTGTGILEMLNRKLKRESCMKWTARTLAIILISLEIVVVIAWCVIVSTTTHTWEGQMERTRRLMAFQVLGSVIQFLLVVGFTWVLVLSIIVSRRVKAARNSGNLYSGDRILSLYYAAVGVSWFGALFYIIYFAITTAAIYSYDGDYETVRNISIVGIVWVILLNITPLIALILLVVLAKRKEGGLWTGSDISNPNKPMDTHVHNQQSQSQDV